MTSAGTSRHLQGVWMVRIVRSPRRDLCWCACAKNCTCAGSSHGLVSSRRSLDLGDGFVKDHWSVKGVDGPKRQRSGVAKAGRVMHLGAWSQQSLAIEESDVQDS